jgi:hypothetical protein
MILLGMECGNDSYRFDCFCSSCNEWQVQIAAASVAYVLRTRVLRFSSS